MVITVVNKYKEPNHVYCGRGSPLGNPFYMSSEFERDKVCDQYQDWFYKHVDEVSFIDIYKGDRAHIPHGMPPNSPQTTMVLEIFAAALEGDVNLGCFCAPKRCHCDTIKQFLDNKLEELCK